MRLLGLVLSLGALGCGRVAFDDRVDGSIADATSGFGFRNLCAFRTYTVISDGITVDDGVGAVMASSLASGCGVTPTTRTTSQDAPGILDPSTGRPLLPPNDLAVIGGGDGPQRALAYLLARDLPVTWTGVSPVTFRERTTGRIIHSGPTSGTHDYALVLVAYEPISGTRILSISGAVPEGTVAGGYWFEHQLAPTVTTNASAWSLVEWTDTDVVVGPSANDQFRLIEAGPP